MDRSKMVAPKCADCRESLLLPPSAQELKRGQDLVVTCCLEPRAIVKLVDGLYPRLTTFVRHDTNMCGPSGRWWRPDTPVVSPEYRARAKENHTPQFYRRKFVETPQTNKPPRKPYKPG